MNRKKLVLIDNGYLQFRSIFAWRNKKQIPSTWYYMASLISALRRIGITEEDRILIAVDSKYGNWRKDIEKKYKANRKEFRDKQRDIDWGKQFKDFNRLLVTLKYNTPFEVVALRKLEADDIIAVACRYYKDYDIVIVSADSDFEQLWIYENVNLFSPLIKIKGGKGGYKIRHKNPYALLAKKIRKETADNLVSEVSNEQEYEERKMLVSLIELPDWVENKVLNKLPELTFDTPFNYQSLPFRNSIGKRIEYIYNHDKVVTYEDSLKRFEKKRRTNARKNNGNSKRPTRSRRRKA